MNNELFESAPIHKAYFKFALPVVTGMVVGLVYNMVDTYFIARTGNTNLIAGVSLGAPAFTFMIAMGDILGLGGASVISRMLGRKEYDGCKRISAFSFYATIALGLLIAALMFIFRTPLLHLLGADEATLPYALQYFSWIALGAPFIIFSLVPTNLLRTEGLGTQVMIGSVVGSVVNIILDPIFISALGLGAAGAAMATVISNIVTDLIFVYLITRKAKTLTLNPRFLRISAAELGAVMAIGIPGCITNMMQTFYLTLTNRFLLPYGNDKIAVFGVVMKLNMIAVMVMVGSSFGAQPLMGYNYGAKNNKRLRDILKFCYLWVIFESIVMLTVLSLPAGFWIGRFLKEPELISTGVTMLRLLQAGMPCNAIILVSTVLFQASGKAVGAGLLSFSRQGIIYAIVIVAMSALFGYMGVILSLLIAEVLTMLMAVILFYFLIWKEIRA